MLERIVIISLIVFAIWYTMLDGEIFGKLGKWFGRVLPSWLHSPVFECPVCMAFWYGLILCFVFGWPLWMPVASLGLNAVITKFFRDDDA